jgi:hypothetical protein
LGIYAEKASQPYFDDGPNLTQDGTLSFTLRQHAFGTTYFTIERNKTDVVTGKLTRSLHNVTVTITAVNQRPSFTLALLPSFREDACRAGGNPCTFGLATEVLKGPNITVFGSKGEDWPESAQKLSFTVSGTGNGLFDGPVSVAPNGSLSFYLVNDANGWAVFDLTLKDNGSGDDTSETVQFTIIIDPVNDPPHFYYNCTNLGTTGSCMGSCTGTTADSSCEMSITVLQNCAFCPSTSDFADGCFTIRNIARGIVPSLTTWPDEAWQTVTFQLSVESQKDSMLQSAIIDAATGTLRCVLFV